MPDNSGTHLQVTAAAVQAVQNAALEGLTSPIQAYSCDLHILNSVQDSQQVTCMTLEDWCQSNRKIQPCVWSSPDCGIEPWGDGSLNRWTQLSLISSYMGGITFSCEKSFYTERPDPGNQRRPLFQVVFPAAHREVTLKGCHDEVGHLGLECMLDLMCDWLFWPHMAAQVKEHLGKCCPCLTFKAKQPKAPLESIVATRPLELVHLDYLCLEPGKGL